MTHDKFNGLEEVWKSEQKKEKSLFIPVLAVSGSGSVDSRNKFKAAVAEKFPNGKYEILHGDIHLNVTFYFPFRAMGDIDNFLNATFDVLKGIMYADDSQVKSLCATIKQHSNLRGIQVTAAPLEDHKDEPPVLPVAPPLSRKRFRKRKKLTRTQKIWRAIFR